MNTDIKTDVPNTAITSQEVHAGVASLPVMFVDPVRPGVIRWEGGGAFDGIIAGRKAPAIVRACNAHDDLVKALQKAVLFMNGALPEEIELVRNALVKAGVVHG